MKNQIVLLVNLIILFLILLAFVSLDFTNFISIQIVNNALINAKIVLSVHLRPATLPVRMTLIEIFLQHQNVPVYQAIMMITKKILFAKHVIILVKPVPELDPIFVFFVRLITSEIILI
jgi:hypothetical protein